MTETNTRQTERGRGQPYGLRKSAEAVKGAVPVETYAADLTELHRNGQGLRGRCPIHGGDNPDAFAVYPDKGRWHCYRCDEGGDVIDLARAVEGGEFWEAMMLLAVRFGVELPQRPSRWHQHQDTKAAMREELRKGITKVYQRRLYRIFGDAGAHVEDDAALWDAMYTPAYLAATERVFG